MGTRGLTCVVIDGGFKVAQYGQWSSYPDGAGVTILGFLRKLEDMGDFKDKVRALESIYKYPEARGLPFHLSRDCGAEILALISVGKVKEVSLDVEFAGDSLLCEWAYVVDLDKGTFEVYRGFCKSEHTGQRFSHMEPRKSGGDLYYPVALRRQWRLDSLPTDKEFCVLAESEESPIETLVSQVEEPSVGERIRLR